MRLSISDSFIIEIYCKATLHRLLRAEEVGVGVKP